MSKDIVLNDKTMEAATLIKSGVTIDKSTGFGTPEDDLFEKYASSQNVTMEQVEQVDDIRTTFGAGSVYAVGELSVDAMASNKKLERVTVEIPVGKKDTLSIAVDRHKSFPNHLTGGDPVNKYAVVTAQYDFIAGKNAGQLKKAKLAIGELGAEKLK